MAFTGKFTTVSSSLVWDGSKFISESLDTIVANRAADKNAQYLVLSNTASLNGERALALGPGLVSVDGGANGLFEISASLVAGSGIVINPNGQNLEISSSLNVDASFVVLGGDPSMPNERVLTGGPGITITDGGPGGQVVVSASLTAGPGVSIVNDNGDIVVSADTGGLGQLFAGISGSFLLAEEDDVNFPGSRALVGGNGIALTDGGAGGSFTVDLDAVAGPGIAINFNAGVAEVSASLVAGPGIVITDNGGVLEISGSVENYWTSNNAGEIKTDNSVAIGLGVDYANSETDFFSQPANFFVSGSAIAGNDLTVRGAFVALGAQYYNLRVVGFTNAGLETVLDTDSLIGVDTAGAGAGQSMTFTIPDALAVTGRRIKITDMGGAASFGNIVITCETPSDGINGETEWTLAIDYSAVELVCVNGTATKWVVV